MASLPPATTLDHDAWRPFLVGGAIHLAIVTNRADQAGQWVRQMPPIPPGTTRIVGLSFHLSRFTRADGFVDRWVDSVTFSCDRRVLVYHLPSAEHGTYSPDVMLFLRNPRIAFVGEDVDEGLYLLGSPFRRSLPPTVHPRYIPSTLDLFHVARVLGVDHLLAGGGHGVGPHVTLGTAVLRIAEGCLRAHGGTDPWAMWPLTHEQEEYAVQSAVIAGILAIQGANMIATRRRLM